MTLAHRPSGERVLIVGGGIAGLAAANALMSIGVDALVLERRRELDGAGLALNLPGNAMAALEQLGLAGELRAIGRGIGRREYRTARGRLLFAVDEDGFWPASTPSVAVRRKDLMHLLASRLPTNAVRLAADVRSIEQREGRVDVTIASGERFSGALLVGADGVNGRTRARLGFGSPTKSLIGDASWRFTVENPGVDCWTTWAGADAIALLMPIPGGQAYGWVTLPKEKRADVDSIEPRMRDFPTMPRLAVELAKGSGTLHHSPLQEVRLAQWSRGRAILIGDAAHATAPVWAQGAAMAIEDAVILAKTLEERGFVDLASAFERRRRPRVGHVQRMTDAFSRAARLPPSIRDLLMPLLGPLSYRRTYGPLRDLP